MRHTFILIICLFSLLACNQTSDVDIKDDSKLLATVGDLRITEAYLNAFLTSSGVQQANEQQKSQALDVLVKQMSLAHQANQSGLELSLQQAFEIQHAKYRALAQAAIDKHVEDNPVLEADIKAEYLRITEAMQGDEYHVRHLLFTDEVKALEVLDQIKAGESYLVAEAAYLLDHPQVKNVGDIGWVNSMQVPEVFRQPLQSMATETTHPRALVSQFGVHVLYLEAKRPLVKPDLSVVEAGIRQTLIQKKIEKYRQLAVIKAKAKLVD